MTKLQFTEKAPPGFSWHVRHLIRLCNSVSSKPLEEGYQLRRERELSRRILVSLGAETNDGPVQINIVKVKASLREATALMPCDEVASEHPLRLAQEGV